MKLSNVKKILGNNFEDRLYNVIKSKKNDVIEDAIMINLISEKNTLNFLNCEGNFVNGKLSSLIKMRYDDIADIKVDGIHKTIKLVSGDIYYLKELRSNLEEVLKDFDNQCIAIYDGASTTIICDFNILRCGKTLSVKGKSVDDLGEVDMVEDIEYKINLDDVIFVDEEAENNICIEMMGGNIISIA